MTTVAMKLGDAQQAEHQVDQFRQGYLNHKVDTKLKAGVFSANKRDALYKQLARAYELGALLLQTPDILKSVLLNHSLKPDAREGSNPWTPVVNLLFGRPGTSSIIKPDRSAWKYGKVFRQAQAGEVEAHAFAAWLEEAGGVTKVVEQDDDGHLRDDPDSQDTTRTIAGFLHNAEGWELSIDPEELLFHGGNTIKGRKRQWFALWAHRKDNTLTIYGELKGKDAMVAREAERVAKLRFKHDLDLDRELAKPRAARRMPVVPAGLNRWLLRTKRQELIDALHAYDSEQARKAEGRKAEAKAFIAREEPEAVKPTASNDKDGQTKPKAKRKFKAAARRKSSKLGQTLEVALPVQQPVDRAAE